MTETDDIVKLPLADAEEGGSITYRVAGEALGTQPRIVESHGQRQVVGAHSAPLARRCVFDFKQRPQTPSTLALQRLDPKLQPLALRERLGLEVARQNIGDVADLISILVFHEILLQARQIDCHLPKLYASAGQRVALLRRLLGRSTAGAGADQSRCSGARDFLSSTRRKG